MSDTQGRNVGLRRGKCKYRFIIGDVCRNGSTGKSSTVKMCYNRIEACTITITITSYWSGSLLPSMTREDGHVQLSSERVRGCINNGIAKNNV